MKQTNISVFIPHYGCTHICSFCNQKTISGHSEPVTEKELESILEGQLENLKDSGTKAQIAFFGGSFTAIDRDYMIRLLTVYAVRQDRTALTRKYSTFLKATA